MAPAAVSVAVDWTNTGTWVEESDRAASAHIHRGRAAMTDVFGSGTAEITLRNQAGRYSPFNTGSALSPNVVGGRPVRIQAIDTGVNACTNGGFEVDTSGWAAFQSTLATSAAFAHSGTQSLGVTATAASFSAEFSATVSGGTAGKAWYTVGWVYVPAGSHLLGLTMQVMVREAGGAFATFDTIQSYTLGLGWQRLSAFGSVVRNDRTSIHAVFYVSGGANVGDLFYLDDVQLAGPGTPEFFGYTTEYTQNPGLPASITIHCVDAFDAFTRIVPTAVLQLGQRTDQIIAALLAAAGWTGATNLESGRVLPAWAPTQSNLLQELQLVAAQELGGALFMGADGSVVFQNAGHRAAASLWNTVTDAEDVQLDVRQADLISRVDVTYNTYALQQTGAQTLFSGLVGQALAAQTRTTITRQLTVKGAVSVNQPRPGTDYSATDGWPPVPTTGGGAIDVSANLSLESWACDGTSFTATFYNGLPYPIYLGHLQVTGIGGLLGQSEAPMLSVAVVSPLVANTPLTLTFPFVTDAAALTAFATARTAALGTQHPRPVVTVTGSTAARMPIVLGADLSLRLHLTDTVSTFTTKLDLDTFIEAIDLQLVAGEPPVATWVLADTSQGTPA